MLGLRLILLVLAAMLAVGCEGPQGDAGPMGPRGNAGPQGDEGPVGEISSWEWSQAVGEDCGFWLSPPADVRHAIRNHEAIVQVYQRIDDGTPGGVWIEGSVVWWSEQEWPEYQSVVAIDADDGRLLLINFCYVDVLVRVWILGK